MTRETTRRERQREETYAEIVRVARGLLAEGQELSLRSVAAGMGLTAPALYRYVGSYQELVDLVAFEIDRAATDRFRAAAATQPDDDPGARLTAACVAFRRWGLEHPREFALVFANPIADTACVRRDLLTAATSGIYMNDLLLDLWEATGFPHPRLEDLSPELRAVVEEPMVPIRLERVPEGHRGLLWLFMRAWASLYGVVALEVFGHMDPRVIESGDLFVEMVMRWVPELGLGDQADRIRALLVELLAQ